MIAAAGIVFLRWSQRRDKGWRRDAVERSNRFYCPHCDLEVTEEGNPMVDNLSGFRIGVQTHDRWCQVCEKNAEQHVIHRS
ncbi:MAG: hypothetical protein HY315_11030 [Acidobacteria bacterium]|nr:hypothetical protein [Acidobacteriota bacterium]